jgi:hypothetical protein
MIIYLCVKIHTKSNLKYFCKTATRDPYVYCGSGLYWKRHITLYGKEYIKTIGVWAFDNELQASQFALKFSKDNKIVSSDNWANLQEENALDGCPPGLKRPNITGDNNPAKRTEVRQKISENNAMKNPIVAKKLGESQRGIPKPWAKGSNNNACQPGVGAKISTALSGVEKKKIICPYCNKIGGAGNMKRYHFDNCKHKTDK